MERQFYFPGVVRLTQVRRKIGMQERGGVDRSAMCTPKNG